MSEGWIGVDLDGTLAKYESWVDHEHIGKPIPEMVARVLRWLGEGRTVKIFTARVATDAVIERGEARAAIQRWCCLHFGRVLEVTCKKDYAMIELWDDRCVQVEPNTGRPIGKSTRGLS